MAATDLVTEEKLLALLDALVADINGFVTPAEGQLYSALATITALADADTLLVWDVSASAFVRITAADMRKSLSGMGTPVAKVLASDDTNSSTSADDITGISWPVVSGKYYHLRGSGRFRTAATTTGITMLYSAPSMTSFAHRAKLRQAAAGTDAYFEGDATSPTTGITSTAVLAANTDYFFETEAWFQPSADGTLQARHASEIGSSNAIVRAGSVWYLTELVV